MQHIVFVYISGKSFTGSQKFLHVAYISEKSSQMFASGTVYTIGIHLRKKVCMQHSKQYWYTSQEKASQVHKSLRVAHISEKSFTSSQSLHVAYISGKSFTSSQMSACSIQYWYTSQKKASQDHKCLHVACTSEKSFTSSQRFACSIQYWYTSQRKLHEFTKLMFACLI